MDEPTWSAFRPDVQGHFVERPNRFVARVNIGTGVVEAHCPNPGRMTELLFPGSPVVLERAPGPRKLAYTLVAVQRPGPGGPVTIPLASVRANPAVGALVLPGLFPGARSIRPEFTLGNSRFDFLVEGNDGTLHVIEVKACSEVEHGTALFPDAPSLRARKHLEELAAWGDRGYRPHVVFAIVHGRPSSFGPNVHTDPDFSRTLVALAPRLTLHAVVLETDPKGSTRLVDRVPVDLTPPGPDAGHLVTLEPSPRGWEVGVNWYPAGFEKAVAKAPARRSFSVRGQRDNRGEWVKVLGAGRPPSPEGVLVFAEDPRTNRAFVDAVMAGRHAPGAISAV